MIYSELLQVEVVAKMRGSVRWVMLGDLGSDPRGRSMMIFLCLLQNKIAITNVYRIWRKKMSILLDVEFCY